jgi:endonuclease YncB( thermonuclease family)
MMRYRFWVPLILSAMLALTAAPFLHFARAQSEAPESPVAGMPDHIRRPMRAVDPMTLKAEGLSIRLWGIKPAQASETPLELKALDLMDSLIQEGMVDCAIKAGQIPELVGLCKNKDNADLAMELLFKGYVIVDRRQTYGSALASDYEKAQETARNNGSGVWAVVNEPKEKNGVPGWLAPHMGLILPIALIFGPFCGLFVVALIMWYWLKKMANVQEASAEEASRKEAMLLNRERQVLVSTLEGELVENKNKIEAFLVIYGDLLRSLKDTAETPKYQQGGDIVQKHPSFTKTVFEANVNKLNLLDIKLSGKISKLYAALHKEQEYVNLEPGLPLDAAVQIVEKVLKDQESLLEPINAVLAGLQGATAAKPAVKAAAKPAAKAAAKPAAAE